MVLCDLGHLRIPIVKEFAATLLPVSERRELGIYWMDRFPKRNPELATRFNQQLYRQRASAGNVMILEDFFKKVVAFESRVISES